MAKEGVMSKNQSNLSVFSKLSVYGVGALLIAFCGVAQAVNLNFEATVLQGGCGISLDHSTVSFDSIDAAKLIQGDQVSEPQEVKVALTGCAGIIGSSLTPSLHIKGKTMANEPNLFLNGGEAAGFGFVISEDAKIDISGGKGLATSDSFFKFAGKSQGQLVSDGDSMVLYTAVSCGKKVNCAKGKAGDLNAAVQLDFIYK